MNRWYYSGDASVKRSHKAGPQGLRALWNANSLESPHPSGDASVTGRKSSIFFHPAPLSIGVGEG